MLDSKEVAYYLKEAEVLARRAGEIISSHFGGKFRSDYKSCPSDLVTEVDRRSEEIILEGLLSKFPGHTFVGEETSGQTLPSKESFTWFVDPLDGTTNFVFGIPFCCISIGLALAKELVAGLVYDPLRDELFTAIKNNGARLNGSVIEVDKKRRHLSEALLVTGYPANKAFGYRLLRINYHRVIESCTNLRALGAAALELAYVACGRLTGFWENTLKPWDVAAGTLLVEEAGGTVTNIDGGPISLEDSTSIAASNGLIHRQLLDVLS